MNPSRPDSMLSRPPLAARRSSEELEQLCYGSIRKAALHREQARVASTKPAAAASTTKRQSFFVEIPDSCMQKDDNNTNQMDDSESTAGMSSLSSWNSDGRIHSPKYTPKGKMIRSAEPHRPTGDAVAALSPASIAKKAAYTSNNPINLPWMRNEDVSKKAVFQIHLKRPTIRIQAAVRGMLVRIHYHQHFVVTKHEPNAATRIQAVVRGVLARIHYRQHLVDTKYERSATAIQTAMRGKLERLRFEQFCKDLLEEYYATNIQKWFRGERLRRGIIRHESALILQDNLRNWVPRAKEYRIQLVHQQIDLEHAHRLEMNKIRADKQREMKHIRKQIVAENKVANKIPPALRMEAQVSETYQMVEYLYAEHEKLHSKQRKLHKGIGHHLHEYEKEIQKPEFQNKEQIELYIETLQNLIIPHLECNVSMGQDVANELNDNIEQTEESIFELSLRTLSEKRMATGTLETMNAIVERMVVEFMEEHDAGDDLVASIYEMAFKVEFETYTKRCNFEHLE